MSHAGSSFNIQKQHGCILTLGRELWFQRAQGLRNLDLKKTAFPEQHR